MSHRKVYIETYGCQMNVNDTEVIFSILAKAGYERTENMDEADVLMANTCSVRDNAEQRIWGRIDQFYGQKRLRDGVVTGIVGCMAERLKDKLLESGRVDFVAGPDSYRSLPSMLAAVRPDHPQINVELSREETYADIEPVRIDKNGVSAFISIMRGCNNVCSYCVVPYTRGAERSRDPRTIVREACDLFSKGYKEVTLLGQNVDSYLWKNPEGDVDFADLLVSVAAISPELRVRFSTSHPKDISDKVIGTMSEHDNICRHIHLPVQSGSDVMLEKMRRRYTREWYLGRVAKIREVMPDCAITTDIIAGFCGETPSDHEDTLSVMRAVGYDYAYMFQYSERPGTLAALKYPDDVPAEEKTRRLNEIIALQNDLSLESNRRDVGKTFRVLVEGPSKRNPDDSCGRASNNKMCVFPSTVPEKGLAACRAGDYVNVKVLSCTSATLICERI
ncbi:MAG: tRNA (N6-isopentenyl adenosine(37)-C2)-methylthiotransferase MiaB [Candidatus Cryptobacteroides sp.]